MIDEIEYHYVKGKGWLPRPESAIYIREHRGDRITIIDRQPTLGEFGWHVTSFVQMDDAVDLVGAMDNIIRQQFHPTNYGWECEPDRIEYMNSKEYISFGKRTVTVITERI